MKNNFWAYLLGGGVLVGLIWLIWWLINDRTGATVQIVDIVDKLEKSPSKTYPTRNPATISKLIVHHSACTGSPANCNPYKYASYHVRSRGWAGIGYHFVISPDGTINQTNRLETISNHTSGQNTVGVGICLSGDFTKERLPTAQKNALVGLLRLLRKKLNKPNLPIFKHGDFARTECPAIDVESIKKIV
jgi:hypothetical protein